MDLSPSSLFAGLIFGCIGFISFRWGKRNSNIRLTLLGVVLMSYSLFAPSAIANWIIGGVLTGLAYAIRNT